MADKTIREQQAIIREKRTIEATKKNLMGSTGRLGVIAQYMGHPIIRQGDGLFDATYLDDPYEDKSNEVYETTLSGQDGPLVYRDEIAESYDYMQREPEGFIFDGLSSGIHLSITYWEESSRIIVNYKGYVVYKEQTGELGAYNPFPEWEDWIEKLYKIAKKRMKNAKQKLEDEIGEEVKAAKTGLLHKLRMLWGI